MASIPTHHRVNFDTLLQAVAQGRILLAACRERATGKDVAMICALNPPGPDDGDDYELVPLAVMVEDPYRNYFDTVAVEAMDAAAKGGQH